MIFDIISNFKIYASPELLRSCSNVQIFDLFSVILVNVLYGLMTSAGWVFGIGMWVGGPGIGCIEDDEDVVCVCA